MAVREAVVKATKKLSEKSTDDLGLALVVVGVTFVIGIFLYAQRKRQANPASGGK